MPAKDARIGQYPAGLSVVVEGEYWEGASDLCGLVVGAVLDGYQHYLKLRATGTHSEVLLKFLSGSPSREVQVHLCGDPRGAWVWKDGLLHASKIREVKGAREAWMDNLGVIAPEVMGEDENAELRREAEAARLDLKRLEEEKRQGLVAEAEKKKKKLKKKKKEEKRVRGSDGKKDPKVVFAGTGLDPDPEIRKKVCEGQQRRNDEGVPAEEARAAVRPVPPPTRS